MYLADQMTVSASLAGIPAISVPLETDQLPIGLQIMAQRGHDKTVFAVANDLEANKDE